LLRSFFVMRFPSSTAGWLNGFTPSISPARATAASKVNINSPRFSAFSFSRLRLAFGTRFFVRAPSVPFFCALRISEYFVPLAM